MSRYFSILLKAKRCPYQLNYKNNDLAVVMKDYLAALKLFPVACGYGWQRWKCLETLGQLFQVLISYVLKTDNQRNNIMVRSP